MKVLHVRNAEEGLIKGLELIQEIGIRRPSRYGPVLYGGTVATVYERPLERVVMWPGRDANPFFHLYEALWMLLGRNDVASVVRYAKRMETFSDDGKTFHGAYGYRWREHFRAPVRNNAFDQIKTICSILEKNSDDRRCVLQMWDPTADLGRLGKDVPCNVSAVVERGVRGEVNLTVFNRSNDIIWGAYGANVVQFSILLEYIAMRLKAPMGVYTQISVNWHAYTEVYEKLARQELPNVLPYHYVRPVPMFFDGSADAFDIALAHLIARADEDRLHESVEIVAWGDWFATVLQTLLMHEDYRKYGAAEALKRIPDYVWDSNVDWVVAGIDWLRRRVKNADSK